MSTTKNNLMYDLEALKEMYRHKDIKADKKTPYKLMVFPLNEAPRSIRFSDRDEAISEFRKFPHTAILTDFSEGIQKVIRYKYIKKPSF